MISVAVNPSKSVNVVNGNVVVFGVTGTENVSGVDDPVVGWEAGVRD